MISKTVFEDNLQEHAELFGWRLSDKRFNKIYRYLNDQGFEDADLIETIKNYERDDFRFGEFQVAMRMTRAARIERLAQLKMRIEDDATREWFRKHAGDRKECVYNYNCGQCKRLYCDIVSIEASEALKDMLMDNKTADEVHEYLAGKFRGIGFERNVKGLEPF
jgi:hypothetical protein